MSTYKLRVGDIVVYGNNGVCTVTDRCEIAFMKGEPAHEYWLLTPVSGGKSTIYVPTDRPELVDKIHPVLTSEEIVSVLKETKTNEIPEFADKAARSEAIDRAMNTGDRGEVLRLIRWLIREEDSLKKSGKKLLMAEENLLKYAEKAIAEEFSFVLKIAQGEVGDYVRTALGERIGK